jgi:hypothetical protein
LTHRSVLAHESNGTVLLVIKVGWSTLSSILIKLEIL